MDGLSVDRGGVREVWDFGSQEVLMNRKLARTSCDRIGRNFLQCPRRDLIYLQI